LASTPAAVVVSATDPGSGIGDVNFTIDGGSDGIYAKSHPDDTTWQFTLHRDCVPSCVVRAEIFNFSGVSITRSLVVTSVKVCSDSAIVGCAPPASVVNARAATRRDN